MESQYLELVKRVLDDGEAVEGRNGPVRRVIGAQLRGSLEGGCVPFVTTKKLAWRTCLRELLWFVSGSTDACELERQGVRIWRANGSREFLDSAGFVDRREGDLGPVYGHQWRHAGAPYTSADTDYAGKGVDQLGAVVAALKDPAQWGSRRLVVCSWNASQVSEMALPPCHVLMQFHVTHGNDLSCSVYQRSADVGLGLPFNLASYGMLVHMLAAHCGLRARELVYHLGDVHIYEQHVAALRGQLERQPGPSPKVTVQRHASLDDYTEADFEVTGYESAGPIAMEMVA